MVVRADNRAYGEKACEFLGEQAGRQGQGRRARGRPGLHQRPGPHRGVQRLHEDEVPRHQGLRRAHRLGGRRRRAKLQTGSTANPDIKGIYMQAGGVPWPPPCRCSSRRACWSRRPTPSTSSWCPTTASRRSSKAIARGRDRRHRLPARRPVRQVRASTSRPRSTARRSSPARPTTTARSSRSATACWRTSSPRRWSPTAAPTADVRASSRRHSSLWGNQIMAC